METQSTYNEKSQKHSRKSIRLYNYDYAQPGLYFVTICCHNKKCLFGKIVNGKVLLNNIGEIANQCWLNIPKHFQHVILHQHIIMPNHVHGIIELQNVVCVGANKYSPGEYTHKKRAKNFSPLQSPSKTVGSVVRGFKIGVTKWVRTHTNIHHVWQRNYYEHIIRNNASHEDIVQYIADNPNQWEKDPLYIS